MSLDASIGEDDEDSSARNSAMLLKAKQWVKKYIPSMTNLASLLDLVLGSGDVGLQNPGELASSNVNALDPEIRYSKLDKLIIEILRVFIKESGGGHALMLVWENAQWIDGQSVKLLHRVSVGYNLYYYRHHRSNHPLHYILYSLLPLSTVPRWHV